MMAVKERFERVHKPSSYGHIDPYEVLVRTGYERERLLWWAPLYEDWLNRHDIFLGYEPQIGPLNADYIFVFASGRTLVVYLDERCRIYNVRTGHVATPG